MTSLTLLLSINISFTTFSVVWNGTLKNLKKPLVTLLTSPKEMLEVLLEVSSGFLDVRSKVLTKPSVMTSLKAMLEARSGCQKVLGSQE